jgi:translocation protein SEC63
MAGGGSGGQQGGGISGSDESFIAFAFAIVSIVMMFLYFPVLIGCVREAIQLVTGGGQDATKRKKRDDEDEDTPRPKANWRILFDDFTELPRVVLRGARHPQHVSTGLTILNTNRVLARRVFFNDAVRFCVRPRFIFLVMWVFLLSSAMYASMTFDPHAVLGIPTSAEVAEVKRACRKQSMLNHPDHNKTEAAKMIYPRVRKACKAILDRDAFDKEVDTEEMSAGIALPSFLTSRNNDALVLVVLLGVLVAVPYWIWKKFKETPIDQFRANLRMIKQTEELLEPLYLQLGIPLDPKYIERRREREELANILFTIGVLPAADTGAVEHLPPANDLKRLCQDPARNAQTLQRLGLPPPLFPALKQFFDAYEPQEKLKIPEGNFAKVDSTTYETIRIIFEKTQAKVQRECADLVGTLERMTRLEGLELRSVKKLQLQHKLFLDLLADVYKQEKPNARDVRALIEFPQKRAETAREIPHEVSSMFQHMQQQAQQQAMQQQRQQQRQ